MNKYITGDKFKSTIDKLSILGIDKIRLNDWVELIDAEEYISREVKGVGELSLRIKNVGQSISIIIDNKKTIIENIESIIYHEKYIIIVFVDETSLTVTQKGKIIYLNKDIYSERLRKVIKLIYNRNYNETGSEFMILNIEGKDSILIINEDGSALKVNFGIHLEEVRVSYEGNDNYIVMAVGSCRNKSGDKIREWKSITVDAKLMKVKEKHRTDRAGNIKPTWEWV